MRRTADGPVLTPPDAGVERIARKRMLGAAYRLDEPRRSVVLQAIRETAAALNWTLHAVHVRSDHVHVVVTASADPVRVLTAFKAYASRYLNQAGLDAADCRRWTRHGSARRVMSGVGLAAAIRYVVYQTGEPMAVFVGSGSPSG